MSRRARSPLSIAEDAFRALTCDPAPLALPLREIGALAPLDQPENPEQRPDGRAGDQVVALDELRWQLRRPGTPVEFKAAVWDALVRRAQRRGGAWTIGTVGMALPRLVRLADSITQGNPRVRHEVDAEILLGFLTCLARIDPDRGSLFPRLLSAAHNAGLAWRRRQRGGDGTPLREDSYASAPPPSPWAHPDLVLADAVTAGVISATEADLICATRLDRLSLAQVAAHLHLTPEAVRKRRSRAEKRLVAALRAAQLDLDPTDPAFIAALGALPLPARSATHRRGGRAGRAVGTHESGCPVSAAGAVSYPQGPLYPDGRPAPAVAR